MNPLVSVIIPAYNASSYIEEALTSVVASDYRPLEIVVVDDGSKDDTLSRIKTFAAFHPAENIIILNQENAGASAARNNAIRNSHGVYILPVDADNKIDSRYIQEAVDVLEKQPEVKVVSSRADFFGERTGEWKVAPFSKALLARKNMIDTCAMYRREDYDKTPGYMEYFAAREDWDFWLSIFEHGGEFVRLPEIRLHYRVRTGSKRETDRQLKRQLIEVINQRHPQYMKKYLGGPLHYQRSWSRFINFFRSEKVVGDFTHWDEGTIIHSGRNTLRVYDGGVIKSFAIPNIWRGILYGIFVKSKARRSYEYAKMMTELTPEPIAYREERYCGVLHKSEYVCRLSSCKHTFNELIGHQEIPQREQILKAIGRFTAELHKRGILHKDYSGGNILYNEDGSHIEVIDLNRIHFCHHMTQTQRWQNFERLNIDKDALRTMAYEYTKVMGDNPEEATEYIIHHRWYKHVKQGITNL